tara:strand:- start:3147 stop:4601 length:1455 start_codon:yes stop_codon:yes gene_type:complete
MAESLTRTPARPLPKSAADQERWLYSAKVRRILYGKWQEDLERRLQLEVGSTRAAVISICDTSHNLTQSLANTLAQSYVRPPLISNPEPAEALIGEGGALARAGYFALMSRFERDLIALRELLLAVSVTPAGDLVLRPVFPDYVVAQADPNDPSRAVEIAELRLRDVPGHGRVWAYDVYSISGVPSYRVVGASGDLENKDITPEALGVPAAIGDAYPFRDSEGAPVLPFVFYHANRTAGLFDPWAYSTVVEGTLSIGVFYSFLAHCMRSASWPQRAAIGLVPSGLSPNQSGRVQEIVTDPTSLLTLTSDPSFDGQGFLHQFAPASDPDSLMSVIASFERTLVSAAGVSAADFARISGDPRSGYSLSITRAALREQQRKIEPQLTGDGETGDTGLFRLCAIMLNRWAESQGMAGTLPESGYSIDYQGVPMSTAEKEAQRRALLEMIAAGLMSPVDAFIELNPGTTEQEARAALQKIAQDRQTFQE